MTAVRLNWEQMEKPLLKGTVYLKMLFQTWISFFPLWNIKGDILKKCLGPNNIGPHLLSVYWQKKKKFFSPIFWVTCPFKSLVSHMFLLRKIDVLKTVKCAKFCDLNVNSSSHHFYSSTYNILTLKQLFTHFCMFFFVRIFTRNVRQSWYLH